MTEPNGTSANAAGGGPTKIGDMPYSRIDIDAECRALEEAARRAASAGSGRELADVRNDAVERAKHIQTMNSLCYIRFTMKPARQLIVALKSRGWWWNSGKRAWSTYLDRLDKEWVAGISERYAKYV